VDYLSRELARLIPVEVRTFGDQDIRAGDLLVRGHGSAQGAVGDAPENFLLALQALRVCVSFAARPIDADVVHCHTWYAQFGACWRRSSTGSARHHRPFSGAAPPLEAGATGPGADLSAWIERTALEAADAVVAVSQR
jgi:hypothetical protein